MTDPLVILTYPGHYLLTGITIKSYFEFNSERSIIILIDDLSSAAWLNYIDDCRKLYSSLVDDITFVVTSGLEDARLFTHNNWVRQQVIKLHLDLLIENKTWLFSDGDVEFCYTVPETRVPFTIVKPGSKTQLQQNQYVAKLLQINNPGIFAEHPDMDWDTTQKVYQVCVSNPPWRWMNSNTLRKLREYVLNQHNITLTEFHLLPENRTLSVTEWELLANFEHYILNQPNRLIYYPTIPIDDNTPNGFDGCKTCYCTDQAFDREWFASKGIEVPDQIWQTISSILY